MGKKTFLKLSVTCTMCLTVAVCYPQDDNAIVIDNYDNSVYQWLNRRSSAQSQSDPKTQISQYKIFEGNLLQNCIKLLENKPFFVIEKNSYARFTGALPKKKYAIAIRAVCKGPPLQFIIYQYESGDIEILNLTLGVTAPRRKAVVFIEVDRLPSNVFVYTEGAL